MRKIALFVVIIAGIGCRQTQNGSGNGASVAPSREVVINVPGEYKTIQAAVDAAPVPSGGTTVTVQVDGSAWGYFERVYLKDGVNLRGNPLTTKLFGEVLAIGIKTPTIVSGFQIENMITAVTAVNSPGLTLEKLTTISDEGFRVSGDPIRINHCTVTGNYINGVGINVVSGSAEINNCIFYNLDTVVKASSNVASPGRVANSIAWSYNQWRSGPQWITKNVKAEDPLFVDPQNQKFSPDEGSPAIQGNLVLGSRPAASFKVRPEVTVLSQGGTMKSRPGFVQLLEFDIASLGKKGGAVYLSELQVRVKTNVVVNVERAVEIKDDNVFSKPMFYDSMYLFNNTKYTLYLKRPLVVNAGEKRTVKVAVDLFHLSQPGDYFEVILEGLRWDDGSDLTSTRIKGLPATGGVFQVQ